MKFDKSKIFVSTLLVQGATAANWKWGMCGNLPSTNVEGLSLEQYAGHWYEVQRDSNLRSYECVTQEINYKADGGNWPLEVYNYVNGNKVVESEKAQFDSTGIGKTKMLSKTKKVAILEVDTDAEAGYALLYTCATDWWMFGAPRHTENAWILSRKDSLDAATVDKLKSTLQEKVPNYDHESTWGSPTIQAGDCKYNAVLTQRREDDPSIPTPDKDQSKVDPAAPSVPDTPTVPTNDDKDTDNKPDTDPSTPTGPDFEQDQSSTNPNDATDKATGVPITDPTNSHVLLIVIGILSGLLLAIVVLYVIKSRSNKKDPQAHTDQERLLRINGSTASGNMTSGQGSATSGQ